jgi:hypothetical protein
VQSDQCRDELGRHTVEIGTELTHSDVSTQVLLVHTAKGTEEIADGSPHFLDSVGVNFADFFAIIISCPFFLTVTDRGM